MKKIFLFILILLFSYVFLALASMDRQYFICPIKYRNDIIVRSDSGGDGSFASNRSGRRLHKGIDLLAAKGTPVLAAKSGKVLSAEQNRGMGKFIIIRHSENMITIYGHLSEISVRKGQKLRQGQVIGRVGRTGNAAGRNIMSHLHFEIRKKGVPQDPLEYI